MSMSVFSLSFVSNTWMCLYKLLPSHHCVTMASDGLLTHPMNRRMLQWRVFFNMATSFLNACSWAFVGVLTFNVFTAIGPCQWALYTVPNDPEPIRGPIRISLASMFQSSPVWIWSRGDKILLLSSADRARWRRFVCFRVFVGDACVECECSQKLDGIGTENFANIFWSHPKSGFKTLFTHTFGAEFDLFSKFNVFGCLEGVKMFQHIFTFVMNFHSPMKTWMKWWGIVGVC